MRTKAAWAGLAVIAALAMAFPMKADALTREEEFSRVVQSINLTLADQIRSIPTPTMIQADRAAGQAALRRWVSDTRYVIQGQTRMLAMDGGLPHTNNPTRDAAILAQHEALTNYLVALGLLVDQFAFYADGPQSNLANYAPWFADAYYDANVLSLRIQRELAFSQADLSQDPLEAASLRVLGHSTEIQLELSNTANSNAHGVYLNAYDMSYRFSNAATAMQEALTIAQAERVRAGEAGEAWEDCLNHEALIARQTLVLADALRARGGYSLVAAPREMRTLLALYRSRPQRTTAFALNFSL